jgi:hypothetical protein
VTKRRDIADEIADRVKPRGGRHRPAPANGTPASPGKGDAYEGPDPRRNGAAAQKDRRAPPETFDAAELVRAELPEPRYAVEGILPEGFTVLAGKPKFGKSWLALNLALAVASGGMALGSIPVERGEVLYLALEDTKRRLQARLRKILVATEAELPAGLTLATSWPRQDQDGLPRLNEWLDAHPACRLVIVDTWPKFRPPKKSGADVYDEDYRHATELKATADLFKTSLLAVAHCRKLAAEDPVDSVSGTLGLTGAADAVLVLKRERGQHDAALFVTGRDIDERELALRWDPQFALWSILGDAEEYRISAERQRVLALFERSPKAMTPAEVAALIDKSRNATKKMLWLMASDGQLEAIGEGLYVASNRGNRENRGNRGNRGNRDGG